MAIEPVVYGASARPPRGDYAHGHARAFLGSWRGSLVCDDFSGYKAGFSLGVILTRLPTQRASQIGELLPNRWQAPEPAHI